jgi:hypothetical protein
MNLHRAKSFRFALGTSLAITAMAILSLSLAVTASATPVTPTCLTNQIRIALETGGEYAAAGNEGDAIALINVSHAPCSLEGYPKLRFYPSSYKGKSVRVTHNGGGEIFAAVAPRRAILQPGATGSFGINYTDAYNQGDPYNGPACKTQSVTATLPVSPDPYSVPQAASLSVNFCFTNFHFGVTSIQQGPLPKTN